MRMVVAVGARRSFDHVCETCLRFKEMNGSGWADEPRGDQPVHPVVRADIEERVALGQETREDLAEPVFASNLLQCRPGAVVSEVAGDRHAVDEDIALQGAAQRASHASSDPPGTA